MAIAGDNYYFEDLDLTLPPQFVALMRRRRRPDVKVDVTLITSNPFNPLPKIVTYDFVQKQNNEADGDGLKYLTQYHLTPQSRERMRRAAGRRWKYPKTYKHLKAIWQKDGRSLLGMTYDEFITLVKTAEKAEKAERARRRAFANAVRGTDGV